MKTRKVFDPEKAGGLYRDLYEVLREAGERGLTSREIQARVSERRGRLVYYREVTRRLKKLVEAGIVEVVEYIGAPGRVRVYRLAGSQQSSDATSRRRQL